MARTSKPPAIDERLLKTLERAFDRHAGSDARIDAAELQRALGIGSEYLAKRMLSLFDTNGDGAITRDEFLEGVRKLVFGSDQEKLRFAFDLHDGDGDGQIGLEDLHRMIAISLAESDVETRVSQPADVLAQALMHAADRNGNGRISFDELEAVVRQRPEVLHKMTRAEALWIAPNEDLLARASMPTAATERVRRLARFLENQWLPVVVVGMFVVANLALFATSLFLRPGGVAAPLLVRLGRATGLVMELDAALVLLPVMRRVLTRVRASFLGRIVPVDEAIGFHKIVGHTLFGLSLAHAAAFLAAYATGHAPTALPHLVTTVRGATGLALLAVFTLMWLAALRWVRRSKQFEIFYFTHLLYVVWLALVLVHAPRAIFWWLGVPLAGFLLEQLWRVSRWGKRTVVARALVMRSGVTALELAKPKGFAAAPGDYLFLRVPSVARFEWHPFTISSAPERDALTVHVRSLGNWTSALRRLVEARETMEIEPPPLVAYVDGPYGAPSAEIFRSRFAVLVGAGIGVTPFASVLESIVVRSEWARPPPIEKAHFFWLNRDQYSFEWFTALLADVEARDTRRVLDLHLFMTDGRTDVTALAVEMAREVQHAWGRGDAITGLRTMTRMGAPDWEVELLAKIGALHAPAKVDVYFCGPPGLGVKVRAVCKKLGMPYREERF